MSTAFSERLLWVCALVMCATACRATFDVAPEAAPTMADGAVVDKAGESHTIPKKIRARVKWRERSGRRIGTVRPRGARCEMAYTFPEGHGSHFADHGVRFDPVEVKDRRDFYAHDDPSLLVIYPAEEERDLERRRCVIAPFAAVESVEVTTSAPDSRARAQKVVGIVIPATILGAAAVVGTALLIANVSTR